MDKGQLIERIRQFNPSATAHFLRQFEAQDLRQYLEHLQSAARREQRIAAYSRPRPRLRMAV